MVIERQRAKLDGASGIVSDANDFANEAMNDPPYPLKLSQRGRLRQFGRVKIVCSPPNPTSEGLCK